MNLLIKLNKSKNINIIISLFIFFLSFLSFNLNFFKFSNDKIYNNFSPITQQSVIDGLLHYEKEKDRLVLGTYSRTEIQNQNESSKLFEFYEKKNTDGKFSQSIIQFGLQIYFLFFKRNRNF